MTEFHKIWIEPCDAALTIRERFGLPKAIGYLVGEKLFNFVRAADERTDFAAELPAFVARVRELFTPAELRDYLDNVHRIGALGHVLDDGAHAFARDSDMFGEEDVVRAAEDVLRMGRIRELLLPEAPGAS